MLDSCFYCGKGLVPASRKHPLNEYTMDHILPISRGGEHVAENIVAACRQCNTHKGNRTLDEFRDLVYRQNFPQFYRLSIALRLAAKMHPSHLSFELETLATRFADANEFVVFEGEKNVGTGDSVGAGELPDYPWVSVSDDLDRKPRSS